MMNDQVSRQSVKDWLAKWEGYIDVDIIARMQHRVVDIPSARPERLTDDDFETIRIHLSAAKEKLGNQHRWKEAEEYQRIIDRFMAFASAQPETAKRIVGKSRDGMTLWYQCNMCNEPVDAQDNFCRGCGRRLTDGTERIDRSNL